MALPMHQIVQSLAVALALLAASLPVHSQSPVGKWEASRSGNSEGRHLDYTAPVVLLGKPTTVKVSFYCDPVTTREASGALGLDIHVDAVAQLKPFHFDDFEGPDATAASKKLVQMTIARKGKPALTFTSTVSGWVPDSGKFAFGLADLSRRASSPARSILRALADDAQTLRIAITDPRNARLKLEFSVPVADQQAEFKALLAGLK